MSGTRRTALGIGLVALAASAGLLARWLVSPSNTPQTATAEGAALPRSALPDPAVGLERGARRPAQVEELAAGTAEQERDCPDLDQVLAALIAQLGSTELYVAQVYDPAVAMLSDGLDAHCLDRLAGRAADERRLAAERLAALSLLRRARQESDSSSPPDDGGVETRPRNPLTPGERRLLEQVFHDREPAPIPLARPGEADPADERVRRDQLARIAGACLAVLGQDEDRRRLVEALDGGTTGAVARAALACTRSADVTLALAERLTDPTRGASLVALALMDRLDDPRGSTLPDELAARVTEAMLQRWRELPPGRGADGNLCYLVLLRLEPRKAADRWSELLDAGQVPEGSVALAARAFALAGRPEDHARLEGLLVEGGDPQRLAAATILVGPAAREGLDPVLKARAVRVLEEICRTSADPLLRRKALYSARSAPSDALSMALGALQGDEAGIVRRAAVLCLQPLLPGDARARQALVRAAETDPDPAVRQAARQALR